MLDNMYVIISLIIFASFYKLKVTYTKNINVFIKPIQLKSKVSPSNQPLDLGRYLNFQLSVEMCNTLLVLYARRVTHLTQ